MLVKEAPGITVRDNHTHAVITETVITMVILHSDGYSSTDFYINSSQNKYHQTCNIRRTKLHNLNVSRLVLKLSVPNQLKPGVKSRIKM